NNVQIALEIAREARQIHGGMGLTGGYSIMRPMMNLEFVVTYEGTHDIPLLILGNNITGVPAVSSLRRLQRKRWFGTFHAKPEKFKGPVPCSVALVSAETCKRCFRHPIVPSRWLSGAIRDQAEFGFRTPNFALWLIHIRRKCQHLNRLSRIVGIDVHRFLL